MNGPTTKPAGAEPAEQLYTAACRWEDTRRDLKADQASAQAKAKHRDAKTLLSKAVGVARRARQAGGQP